MEPFIGQVMLFAGNFAPRGWAFCDGQLLSINQNQALFSILGTTYGGDGRTSFGLPDLRGRAPIHAGQGPGLTSRQLGQRGGAEGVTLTHHTMPSHKHDFKMNIVLEDDNKRSEANNGSGSPSDVKVVTYKNKTQSDGKTSVGEVINGGNGQAHENMPPYLTMNYIIALQGTYPSRS